MVPTSQVVVAAGVIPLQRRVAIFIVRISVARLLICLSCSLDRMYQCDPMLSVFLCLTHFTQHNSFQVYPWCHRWQDFILYDG